MMTDDERLLMLLSGIKKEYEAVQELRTGTEGLQETLSESMNKLQTSIRFSGVFWIILGGFFCLLFGGMVWYGVSKSLEGVLADKKAELGKLEEQILENRVTLAELEGKTWGVAVIKTSDGERVLYLPKGHKFGELGEGPKGTKYAGRAGVCVLP